MNEFKRTGLDKLVDGRLNVRCANYGYQYSDIMLALFSIYLCGGDHIEDITTILNKYLSTAPGARIPSSDTIARGLKELVEVVFLRTDTFYLRASSCADRRQMYEQCKEWRHTTVNGQDMDVASSEFIDFLSGWHLRLVVQRTEIDTEQGEQFLPGMEYIYRAILTNDHDSTEEQVIDKYNQRGACEKNFDVQNNDFGWAHLPFSTMEDNTVFLLFTAMLKNFYQYLLSKVSAIFPGIDMKSRLKRFVFAFIVVPAKWIRVARQWTLNRKTDGCITGPFPTPATDKLKVLEGLQCNIPDGG